MIEKELLAIVVAFKKFSHYILGRRTTFFTDHAPSKGLMKHPKATSARVARWCMILSKYDSVISYRAGKLNWNADALSR